MSRQKKKKRTEKKQKLAKGQWHNIEGKPPAKPTPPPPVVPDAPQHMFDALVKRLDALTKCWMKKWPDGINPEKYLNRTQGPQIRAYQHGVRAQSLYDEMTKQAEALTIPGLCPEPEVANVEPDAGT